MMIRALELEHAPAAAQVLRASFDERLPWLAGLHTPDEDIQFLREHVIPKSQGYGAFEDDRLLGIIAFKEGWIDQLYVLPDVQGQGIGSALLETATSAWPELSLWTFQRNTDARRFYERRGFVAVEETDGSTNEEREPDVRYCWRRPQVL